MCYKQNQKHGVTQDISSDFTYAAFLVSNSYEQHYFSYVIMDRDDYIYDLTSFGIVC
jgi:dolichyl-phosphate-mannose--protein O-mannosyl transferase